MNIYRTEFSAACPNNGAHITYTLEIRTERVIMVEDIVARTRTLRSGYHEQIADRLHKVLGGEQVLRAHHHGVDIETHRGGQP